MNQMVLMFLEIQLSIFVHYLLNLTEILIKILNKSFKINLICKTYKKNF